MLFAILLITLILFLTAFVVFFVRVRKMDFNTFRSLCGKKISRIAKRKNLLFLDDVNIANYDGEQLFVNHIIFGKKYIYLISDFLLKGFVEGDEKNNSWLYFDNNKRKHLYLDNLDMIADKNMRDFAGILQISPDPIVNICLVPNECDFRISDSSKANKTITHYSALNRVINSFESKDIGSLNPDQITDEFKLIKSKNEERNR